MLTQNPISQRLLKTKLKILPIEYYTKKKIHNLSVLHTNIHSKLLQNHLIFIGLPFSNGVTELLMHQILYAAGNKDLNYLTFMINSMEYNNIKSYSSYSFLNVNALIDTMRYLEIKSQSLILGKSFGSSLYFFSNLSNNSSYSFIHCSFCYCSLIFRGGLKDSDDLNRYLGDSNADQKMLNNLIEKNLIHIKPFNQFNKKFNSTEALALGIIDNIIS